MNVLLIVPDFYPNSTGFANATYNLISSILRYGHQKYSLFVFTTVQLNAHEELKNVNVYRYKNIFLLNRVTKWVNEIYKYKILEKIVQQNNIDVILFETNTFPFLENLMLKKYENKVYVRIHSTLDTEAPIYGMKKNFFERLDAIMIKKFMEKVHNIVSTSNFYLDFIRHNFLHDNVYKMWNKKSYGLLCNTAGIAETTSNPVFKNHFLTLGKMSEQGVTQKGILDLLRAIYYIKDDNKLPNDFKLTIIGDGDTSNKIIELKDALALSKNVEMIGNVSHDMVLNYIKSAKAIILLSRFEGQSMFITEALALGKPLILTSGNGMEEMITEGYNGYLVKTGDALDAAEKIKKMMALSSEEIKEYSENSLFIYKTKYSENSIFKQFEDMIKFKY